MVDYRLLFFVTGSLIQYTWVQHLCRRGVSKPSHWTCSWTWVQEWLLGWWGRPARDTPHLCSIPSSDVTLDFNWIFLVQRAFLSVVGSDTAGSEKVACLLYCLWINTGSAVGTLFPMLPAADAPLLHRAAASRSTLYRSHQVPTSPLPTTLRPWCRSQHSPLCRSTHADPSHDPWS